MTGTTSKNQSDYGRQIFSKPYCKYCLQNFRTTSLPNLYFYNALAHLVLEEKEQALISAKKTFMIIFIEGNKEKFAFFKSLFEKQFNMKLDELIRF